MLNPVISVENLGVVRQGQFTQKPLTLFCGPNNSGKTWVMYSLYHCYQWLYHLREENRNEENGRPETSRSLNELSKRISDSLPRVFNTSPEKLEGAHFNILELGGKSAWDQDMLKRLPPEVFLMPAERNGLHLFFRELSTRRTALLHHASRENIDLNELLKDVIRSRYAIPIAAYIDWLNQLADIQRGNSSDFHDVAQTLKKRLAQGVYSVDKRTGDIAFRPYQRKRDGQPARTLGLHMASSTVKSLFGLWFYLENQAKKGDLLMIDEPELNIHPENQREIARMLAKLVNAGINVVISTHSDYIVRELNTLIMLVQDDGKLRRKYEYLDEEVIEADKVAAYLFDDQKIEPFEVTPQDGIHATTFDEVIRSLNTVNDDIYYSLREKRHGQGRD